MRTQDVGGQDKLRPFWRHYYTGTQVCHPRPCCTDARLSLRHGTQGIIFVVDSSDSVRFDLVREELEAVVQDDQLTVRARPRSLSLALTPSATTAMPQDAAVLILANKQDLPGALSADELRRALNVDRCRRGCGWLPRMRACSDRGCSPSALLCLRSICDRKAVLVQPTVASTGEGLVEGIRWLCLHMRTL